MSPKWMEVFDEIVFAVARLIFGDTRAARETYQNVIRLALKHLGVDAIISEAFMEMPSYQGTNLKERKIDCG